MDEVLTVYRVKVTDAGNSKYKKGKVLDIKTGRDSDDPEVYTEITEVI